MVFVPLHISEDVLDNFGVLTDTFNIIVDVSNVDQSVATEFFNKTLSATEGFIRLWPVTKFYIWAFVQWTRDRIRLDDDIALVYFKVTESKNLIEIWNTHKRWTDNASNMAKNKIPKSSSEKMEFHQTIHFIIHENTSQTSNSTEATESILSGRNKQAFLRYHNDRKTRNVLSKQRIGKSKAVPEPPPDTVAIKEVDNNADTCCLWTNFIHLTYTNRSADVYYYNDAYDLIENVPIVSGTTAHNHPNGTTFILVFHELL